MLLWLGGKQLKKELKRKNKSRVELWARKVVANGDAVGTFWLRCPDLGRQLVKRGNSSGMMICKEITVAYHAFFSFLFSLSFLQGLNNAGHPLLVLYFRVKFYVDSHLLIRYVAYNGGEKKKQQKF